MEESLFSSFIHTLIAFSSVCLFFFVALAWVRIQHIHKGKNTEGQRSGLRRASLYKPPAEREGITGVGDSRERWKAIRSNIKEAKGETKKDIRGLFLVIHLGAEASPGYSEEI